MFIPVFFSNCTPVSLHMLKCSCAQTLSYLYYYYYYYYYYSYFNFMCTVYSIEITHKSDPTCHGTYKRHMHQISSYMFLHSIGSIIKESSQ